MLLIYTKAKLMIPISQNFPLRLLVFKRISRAEFSQLGVLVIYYDVGTYNCRLIIDYAAGWSCIVLPKKCDEIYLSKKVIDKIHKKDSSLYVQLCIIHEFSRLNNVTFRNLPIRYFFHHMCMNLSLASVTKRRFSLPN